MSQRRQRALRFFSTRTSCVSAISAVPRSVGMALCAILILGGCADMSQILQSVPAGGAQSNEGVLVRGIKESLELSSTRAADLLSKVGSYRNHPVYRIKLPESVQPIAGRLRQFGLGGQVDRIELLMNQAAEQAAAQAKVVFVDAVRSMSVTDALGIVRGHETAATDYFRRQTESSLRQRYLPIVQDNLRQIGFYSQYQQLLTAYKKLPLSNKPELDLEQHVLDKSLGALFSQVAEEEKLIRKDPLGRGSGAIAAVFGR
jgi:hypothetical protein